MDHEKKLSGEDLIRYVEALDINLHHLLAASDLRNSLKEYLGQISIPEKEKISREIEAAVSSTDSLITSIEAIQDYLKEQCEPAQLVILDGIHRTTLPADLIKAETQKAYLIEFPRFVTNTKETSLWISKKYADREDNQLSIRFYPLFEFTLRQYQKSNNHFDEISSRKIDAITFSELCLSTRTFFQSMSEKTELNHKRLIPR